MKVDFGDFQFMRIEPQIVRYVSGVATALLGSGGLLVSLPCYGPIRVGFDTFSPELCISLLRYHTCCVLLIF